jgi:hypothetical protein
MQTTSGNICKEFGQNSANALFCTDLSRYESGAVNVIRSVHYNTTVGYSVVKGLGTVLVRTWSQDRVLPEPEFDCNSRSLICCCCCYY